MSTFGPEILHNYNTPEALKLFINQCTTYVSRLSQFKQYCIFRYTIGSASVNYHLIFNKNSENAVRWTYLFFLYFKNTFVRAGETKTSVINKDFKKWTPYFKNPQSYTKSPQRETIATELINTYIITLRDLILKAPVVTGSFNVYKVASKYPALPEKDSKLPVNVLQLPFNSTTISPNFNFAPFVSPESECCLFSISIPKGSKCLYIPTEYHAYPFENEILLPFSCVFHITKLYTSIFNYIDPKTVNLIRIQDENKIRMGNVYILDDYFPCGSNKCEVISKQFNTYDCDYINPML